MGLFQMAVETYDSMENLAGKRVAEKEILAPIGHIITKASIEITIDEKGNYVSASKVDEKIPIPVTEKSSGRTSSPEAHPLCDTLEYIAALDDKKHESYLNALRDWACSEYSDIKLELIYEYVRRGSVLNDLKNADLLIYDNSNNIKNKKDIISWRVIGIGTNSGSVCDDSNLQKLFHKYYEMKNNHTTEYCMITGERTQLANQHIKGISSLNGNAKVISANDTSNFTYRGRFKDATEALTISYEASQKAHNALKWLISNDGIKIGNNRTIVCWNPHGISTPQINLPLLFNNEDKKSVSSYRETLKRVIYGYKKALNENEPVVIATFDAATSGRLSVTYYNELNGSDFLNRLMYWDNTCCWYSSKWGASAPSLYHIANFAFGTYRGDTKSGKFDTDIRVLSQQMQRLISCRVDKVLFPKDILKNVVSNTSKLQLYSSDVREKILFTSCAVIRKYRNDYYMEDLSMTLDSTKKDRSYQYGRLLAVLEKIERDTYSSDEKREPNAIRLQAFYVQRPQAAFSQIMTQLKTAYYPRLNKGTRVFYDNIIGDIMNVISSFELSEIGKPLDEMYLVGYYLQKNNLYMKKDIAETEEVQ